MSRKVNLLLVGNNDPEIIIQLRDMIIQNGGHIVNIVKNFNEADLEIDISGFNGTSSLDIEVLRILGSASGYKKSLRHQKKAIKKRSLKIRWLLNKFKKFKNDQ